MKRLKGVFILCLAVAVLLGGCGIQTSHKSPEGVVKSIINAYQHESEKSVKKCFGIDNKDKIDETTKNEINYNLKFFKAHKAKDVSFRACQSLGSFNGYDLVYVIYDYEIKPEAFKKNIKSGNTDILKAPSISLYFVKNKDKKYYVVPSADINADMSEVSKQEYAKFIKTEEYKNYENDYAKFIKDNPDYEKNVADELDNLTGNKE